MPHTRIFSFEGLCIKMIKSIVTYGQEWKCHWRASLVLLSGCRGKTGSSSWALLLKGQKGSLGPVGSCSPVILRHVIGQVRYRPWERAKGQTQVLEAEPRQCCVFQATPGVCLAASYRSACLIPYFSSPETGKRKRVTRKADGKLTLLVNLGGSGTKSWRFWLLILAYPFQGHWSGRLSGWLCGGREGREGESPGSRWRTSWRTWGRRWRCLRTESAGLSWGRVYMCVYIHIHIPSDYTRLT